MKASSNIPPEITAYHDYIARHGQFGGWDEGEHATFVKLWKKHHEHGQDFVESCFGVVSYGLFDIQRHVKWYTNYIKVVDEYKRVIGDWKKQKKVRIIPFIT